MPVGVRVLLLSMVLVASPAPAPAAPQGARVSGLGDLSQALQELARKVSPSVVQIFVTGYGLAGGGDRSIGGDPVLERGNGSGVIVSPDGYIVTNAHVLENATRLEVELPFAATGGEPGRSILGRRGRLVGAQIVAVDEETDLAVIKVDARTLPALPFGDSDALRPGQLVLAFGSPLGLSSSVTMGIISAVARQLTPENPMIYIQTDAPINPGNSGGALVDTEGRLVGINTLIYTRSGGHEGIGFAAPSNIVGNIVGQIMKFGRVRRGEIGINAQTITPVLAEALALPVQSGVILSDVAPRSPAAAAGLLPGDIVTALDGKPMENGRQLRINIYARGVGEQVTLDVRRGDRTQPIRVPVGERPDDPRRLQDLIGPQQSIPKLGVTALDLTPPIAPLLGSLRRDKGAVIARVAADAPYSQQGRVLPGDVIYVLNGKTIESAADLRTAAEALPASSAAVLHLEREGVLLYVAFRIER
jgi:serine protease Do